MNILIVSYDYPTSKTIDYMFTDQMAKAFVKKGHRVIVISPQSLTKCLLRHVPVAKKITRIYISENQYVTLLRPKYVSAGTHGGIFNYLIGKGYSNAIGRAFNSIKEPIDVCIGEFWNSTKAIYPYLRGQRIPLFAQCGEEEITQKLIGYSDEDVKEIRNYVTGVINVSTKNENESRQTGLIDESKTCVIPNGIDETIFYPRDRVQCRERLGLKEEDFVVAFLGQFNSRKGVLRLDKALKSIGTSKVKAIFMGRGVEDPTYNGIVYKGTVMHDSLPEYLSAADVFVLPTNNEGCANAVIEAMACGLPIITADMPFSHDILDKDSALLINPEDEKQIAESIKVLMNDSELRNKLADCSLERAKELTLGRRIDKMVDYMQNRLQKQ